MIRVALCSLIVDTAGARAAGRLVRSLRWFGGAAAAAPIALVALRPLDAETAGLCAAEHVTVRVAASDWRATMAEVVVALAVDVVLLVASDTLIVGDPEPHLAPGRVHVLPSAPVLGSAAQRRRLAELCAVASEGFGDCESSIVAAAPRDLALLLARWLAFSQTIRRNPAVLGDQGAWLDAVAFALAVATFGDRRRDLPPTMGLPAHAPLPPVWDPTIDAVIVRGVIADATGQVAYTPYPFVQARLGRLNRRLAGHVPRAPAPTGCTGQPCAQVVVLGMHRSGTSLLAGLLALAGLRAGVADDFPPPDAHNRRGYWELLDVWAIDEVLFRLVGAAWDDPGACDLDRLRAADRARLAARAAALVGHLDRHGPWVVKDPRLSLLLPFWRSFLTHPVAVLVYREPLAVARSLAARDGFTLARGVALWERYNRAALTASEGLPRLVVAQRDLIADPGGTMVRLVAGLAAAGVRGLAVPDATVLAAHVEPALVHHGGAAADAALTPAQAALLAALERERVRAS
jgi:hypothetical protein